MSAQLNAEGHEDLLFVPLYRHIITCPKCAARVVIVRGTVGGKCKLLLADMNTPGEIVLYLSERGIWRPRHTCPEPPQVLEEQTTP